MIDVDEKSFEQIVAEAFDETVNDDNIKNAIDKLYFAYDVLQNTTNKIGARLGMAYISEALFYLTNDEKWKQNANDCYNN